MRNILDMLFIKDINLDKTVFRNLYYSSNKSSFAGFELNKLKENKNYNQYEILKEIINDIGVKHKEYKAFIKLDNIIYFIRILKDNDEKIYDILMYLIKNKEEYDKYDNIFFPNIIQIPNSLKNINKCILYINDHINMVKNSDLFVKYLGYEDWDYKNKCLNMIDVSCEEKILNDFNKKDFNNIYTFKKNGGEEIKLELYIKYIDGFYYIDEVAVKS